MISYIKEVREKKAIVTTAVTITIASGEAIVIKINKGFEGTWWTY